MNVYYAEIDYDFEGEDMLGVFSTFTKCCESVVKHGLFGDGVYIYEQELDCTTVVRAWTMTNHQLAVSGNEPPKWGPAVWRPNDEHSVQVIFGTPEDYLVLPE